MASVDPASLDHVGPQCKLLSMYRLLGQDAQLGSVQLHESAGLGETYAQFEQHASDESVKGGAIRI